MLINFEGLESVIEDTLRLGLYIESIGLPPGQLSVTKLKEEPATPKRGLSRSNSSPNIAKMLFDEEQAPKTRPVVDRGAKPQPR